jgi:dipeptidyl aminopeptidase/acylaminoacyl peptidase
MHMRAVVAAVVALGWTLLYPPFLATSPARQLVAVDDGGDRVLPDDKTILLCRPDGGCTGLPGGQPGPTNTDPALSPDGTSLAFVHGSGSSVPANFTQASISQWYATRSLWILPLTGGRPHQLTAAGTSVADPTWSAGSQFLLYVRDDGLWLIDPDGGGPARIITALFRGGWPSYYYYIDWRDQFAWSSPRRP